MRSIPLEDDVSMTVSRRGDVDPGFASATPRGWPSPAIGFLAAQCNVLRTYTHRPCITRPAFIGPACIKTSKQAVDFYPQTYMNCGAKEPAMLAADRHVQVFLTELSTGRTHR
ncbi:hypothetical protein ACYJW8_11990 [Frateuria aurantia]